MRREVKLFIEGIVVDQFQDTQIQMKSSIQNVADISKVFTDLTQAFTIPATPNNNQIFHHFYESDVTLRNNVSLDFNLRRKALIEIDTITYRTGKVGIEKANLKNGKVESYSITFYGDLVSMKDIFGDFKLSDLDWIPFDTPYDFNFVADCIEYGNQGIQYPLISSARLWDLGGTTPANNISTTTGAIDYKELFPAIPMEFIIKVIETFFNVHFTGLFRQDNKWLQAHMWFKNKSENAYITPPVILGFQSADGQGNSIGPNDEFTVMQSSGAPALQISTQYGRVTLWYVTYSVFGTSITDYGTWKIYFTTIVSNPAAEYYVDVYLNGTIFNTITQQGNMYFEVYSENNSGNPSLYSEITFQIRSDSPITLYADITVALYVFILGTGTVPLDLCNIQTYSVSTSAYQSLKTCAPDLKVIDFLQGIIKMFNLTIIPTTDRIFKLETLETWYGQGGVYDVTEYTDVTTIDVARVKLYQSIDYKYQKSEGFIGRAFQGSFFREYGDLSALFPYDGQSFKVDLPFEDLMTQRFSGTSTVVGYALNTNFQQYVPKPVVLYFDQTKPTSIVLTDGANYRTINSYALMSADATINTFVYSLNFGAEISVFYNAIVPNGLYATYYQSYIQNLFSRKNRMTSVKIKLPLGILTSLELNDRLVIGDKRYIINDFTLNLSTGEADFVLLNDFRQIVSHNQGDDNVFIEPMTCIQYLVLLNKQECLAEIVIPPNAPPSFAVFPTTLTESGYITICWKEKADIGGETFIIGELERQNKPPVPNEEIFFLDEVTDDYLIKEDSGGGATVTIEIRRTNCVTNTSTQQFINVNQLIP